MLSAIIVFFLIAAFAGAFVLTSILKNQQTAKPVALLHGAIAVIGLLMLIVFVITRPTSYLLLTSLGLFILAAFGGLYMFIVDISKKPVPKVVAVIHPMIAIIALTLLVVYVLQ